MPNIQEVDRKDYYRPASSPIELKAYQAAHKILSADFEVTHLATPGARRSKTIDEIARIIMEAYQPGGDYVEPKLPRLLLAERGS